MASSQPSNKETHDQEQLADEFQHSPSSLPKDELFGSPLCLYQGFWCPTEFIFNEVAAFQNHFQARDTDIILASLPKSGTTWLKALIFTIANRKELSNVVQHPLRSKNPHELVLHLEFKVYQDNLQLDLANMPSPRLLATHLPYPTLPESIKTSNCRIVYVCRNPLDQFISICHYWHQFDIYKGDMDEKKMIEEYAEKYCKGIFPFGPYKDHLLGYWNESVQNPQKALFLEYEGLKKEPKAKLKRLAEFMGCPFSDEEEERNVIDEIIQLCSLKSLKEMEVNKSGKFYHWVGNKAFFRKGEIGDWTNYLTPTMAKHFDNILQSVNEAGISFKYFQTNL